MDRVYLWKSPSECVQSEETIGNGLVIALAQKGCRRQPSRQAPEGSSS